ncbi:hypothetical protein [Streptomyces sp. NPDC058739]|uniref:hypothetical protein n=1 Tax=Streptomyces sp. NPDC058739 TaxID=3346618 RepID=UPI00368111AA
MRARSLTGTTRGRLRLALTGTTRGPLRLALFETLLTGGCAVAWLGTAALLHLSGETGGGGVLTASPAGALVLSACAALGSLPLTWALRAVPALRRAADRAVLVRAAVVLAVSGVLAAVLLSASEFG